MNNKLLNNLNAVVEWAECDDMVLFNDQFGPSKNKFDGVDLGEFLKGIENYTYTSTKKSDYFRYRIYHHKNGLGIIQIKATPSPSYDGMQMGREASRVQSMDGFIGWICEWIKFYPDGCNYIK